MAAASLLDPAGGQAQAIPAASATEPVTYPIDIPRAPRPVARATRARNAIVIDGRLSEADWDVTQPITNFVQSQPDRGALATEQTVARILYDERHLYLGITLYDSQPENIVVTSLERDYGGLAPRDFDVVSFTLDTFLDRRNSFLFHVNPAGAVRDAQTSDNGRTQNAQWGGVWYAEAMVTDSGWVAEVAIPWTTLRFDVKRAEQVWGLNFRRRVRWKNEESAWAPLERHEQSHRMSRAGTLVGLDSLRAGRNVSVKPYGLIASAAGALVPPGDRGRRLDAGVDVKYGITPRMTLDLTYRTDFSQADDDDEQVNLTRFSLFRPERRDFFLENAAVFSFGDVTERSFRMGVSPRDFTLFHSRRIGLDDEGRAIPIVGGGRLTGRMQGFKLGLLTMQTQAAYGLPAQRVAIVRARREILATSDAGFMFVDLRPTGSGATGQANRSYGMDANIRPRPEMIINSYIARSPGPGADADDVAWRVSAGWRDRTWDASALVRQVGESFDPGVGFVRRHGIRQHYTTIGVHSGVGMLRILETNPYVEFDYVTDRRAVLETQTITVGLSTELLDGATVEFAAHDRFERLAEPFRVTQRAEVPAGDYAFREGMVSYSSNRARKVATSLLWSGGGYFHGTRHSVEAATIWHPNHRWSLNLAAQRNDVRLPDAAFATDVLSLRLAYAHSRTLFARASVQYNGATDQLVTNVRLNLIHAPLSDLFMVFAERRDLAAGQVLERGLTAKLTRLVSF